jgi:hypothetical protein
MRADHQPSGGRLNVNTCLDLPNPSDLGGMTIIRRPLTFDGRAHALTDQPENWNPPRLAFEPSLLPPLGTIGDSEVVQQIWPVGGPALSRQDLAWEGDAVLQLAATMNLLDGNNLHVRGLAVS